MTKYNRHRVVITGIGLVTPLGNSVSETWESLLAGKSGIINNQDVQLTGYPYKTIGRVTGEQEQLDKILSPKEQRKTDRFIHLAMLAGHQALDDAGYLTTEPVNRDRFGVCVGVGVGGMKSVSESGLMLEKRGVRGISPFLIPRAITNMAPNWLSINYKLYGPSLAVTSACSSGGDAIGQAFRMIRDGYADSMLAGGAESSIFSTSITAFGNMRALSSWSGDPTGASRPFDKNRTGFVMAEGAGIMVLEREDLAIKRGASIYAKIVGYGATSDAYHITAMHPDGRGAVSAINQALSDARIDRSEIGYVNAHGTGTPMNDSVETTVLKKVFGHHIEKSNPDRILVGSTKSMTGHMIGAAGGAEVAFSALALKNQVVPPTINIDTPDPACDLDYIANTARQKKIKYAISNSFGFGGGNTVIVLKKD